MPHRVAQQPTVVVTFIYLYYTGSTPMVIQKWIDEQQSVRHLENSMVYLLV